MIRIESASRGDNRGGDLRRFVIAAALAAGCASMNREAQSVGVEPLGATASFEPAWTAHEREQMAMVERMAAHVDRLVLAARALGPCSPRTAERRAEFELRLVAAERSVEHLEREAIFVHPEARRRLQARVIEPLEWLISAEAGADADPFCE